MADTSTPAKIQQTSARLRRVVSWLLASLAVLLVLERFGAVTVQLFTQGFDSTGVRKLAFECIGAVPEVLHLVALWWIRQALAAIAEGKFYTPTITRMIDRVGTMLAAGSFISVFLVPSASRAVGFGPGYVVAYDVSGLVLCAVGLSLKVIAHLLRRASEMQAELDEIF